MHLFRGLARLGLAAYQPLDSFAESCCDFRVRVLSACGLTLVVHAEGRS